MKLTIYSFIYLFFFASISLTGQVMNRQEIEKGTGIKRNALYNLEEIKVRWKKAALENCPGVPCVVTPPGPPPFTCGTSTVSDIDGNAYNTVLIGTQCWTKENLKVTKYNNNDPIPDNTNSWNTNPTGARTEYVASGVIGYVGNYGYLYNWYAVNDSRNICPAGWHVPTLPEWLLLETTVGINTAAPALKSTSSLWNSGLVANNSSGFSALPGGFRYDNGNFGDIRDAFYIWTNTTNSSNNSLAEKRYIYLSDNTNVANWSNQSKAAATSIRCLKD
jgi:uncharacterized protein (TIGR02145 family)